MVSPKPQFPCLSVSAGETPSFREPEADGLQNAELFTLTYGALVVQLIKVSSRLL